MRKVYTLTRRVRRGSSPTEAHEDGRTKLAAESSALLAGVGSGVRPRPPFSDRFSILGRFLDQNEYADRLVGIGDFDGGRRLPHCRGTLWNTKLLNVESL